MNTNQELIDSLNELVQINNDRIRGYESSIDNVEDAALAGQFRQLIVQSQKFRSELADHIVRLDGHAVTETTTTDLMSKFHRAWLDIKASVSDNEKAAVLGSVEFGENAAVEAYEAALKEEHLPANVKEVIQSQLTDLRAARDQMVVLKEVAE